MRWSPFSSAVAVALVLGAAGAAPAQLRLERVVRADGPTVGFVEDPVAPGTFLLVGQDGLVAWSHPTARARDAVPRPARGDQQRR